MTKWALVGWSGVDFTLPEFRPYKYVLFPHRTSLYFKSLCCYAQFYKKKIIYQKKLYKKYF